MAGFRHVQYSLLLFFLTSASCVADVKATSKLNTGMTDAGKQYISIEHLDPIEIDPTLTLTQLVDLTLEQYPDRLISEGLSSEADALQERGDAWFAGSNALYLEYSDDQVTNNRGFRQGSVKLEFTPWFWGQRTAAQQVASQAQHSAQTQSAALKLEVARLVREALWDMALAENSFQQAKYSLDISGQLLAKVQRRVELGDMARADLLLAESEHLQNRSLYNQAEAEMMHSRKSYASLTRSNHVPANYQEQLSTQDAIQPNHPLLEAINAIIGRKQATIEWAKTTDTINQPKVNVGAQASHDPFGGGNSQNTGIGVVIPFGHGTYDAPEIAAAHLELNRALAQREHLQRALEKNLHEAEHNLEVTGEQLKIAKELKLKAETHLKMTETSFAAGEINLLDLLKIQARSLQSIRNANEQEVKLQRYIALYNQALGVLP